MLMLLEANTADVKYFKMFRSFVSSNNQKKFIPLNCNYTIDITVTRNEFGFHFLLIWLYIKT